MKKPRVGISRCLLGDPVRHDGGHKRNLLLLDTLGPRVEWVPVCPEVEIGMGTPREPIHLVAEDDAANVGDRIRLIGVESRRDWTSMMTGWSRSRIQELEALGLSGYVFKADSPSCGLEHVPVLEGSTTSYTGRGLFARELVEAFPDLPIEDERRLSNADVLSSFIERVLAYHRLSAKLNL